MASTTAAELPDPGGPDLPAILATFFAFAWAAVALARGGSWKDAERAAFKAGFIGTGVGVGIYLLGLITGVY